VEGGIVDRVMFAGGSGVGSHGLDVPESQLFRPLSRSRRAQRSLTLAAFALGAAARTADRVDCWRWPSMSAAEGGA
jgi:hypothetical protein